MQKLNAAESIRGLACMAVVFSHLSLSFFPDLHAFDVVGPLQPSWMAWIHQSPFGFWFSGTAAVYVFFVLSGYVLSFAIYKHANQLQTKVKNMLYKRYPRLAIPALFSCLLTWLLFQSFQVDPQNVGAWLADYLTQSVSLKDAIYQGAIGSFLFAQSSVNWVLWTMQVELFGSLLLFLLILIRQYQQWLFFLAAVLLLSISYWIWSEGVFLGLSCFVLGMLIYAYARELPLFVAILMGLSGLYLAGTHDNSGSYQWLVALLGTKTYDYANALAGVLLVYSILMSPQISSYLDQKGLVKLGEWSFSIYLLHLPLLYLVCVPVLNQLIHWQVDAQLAVWAAIFIFLCALLRCAAIYSRYVDRFAIQVSQDFAQKIQSFHQNK